MIEIRIIWLRKYARKERKDLYQEVIEVRLMAIQNRVEAEMKDLNKELLYKMISRRDEVDFLNLR